MRDTNTEAEQNGIGDEGRKKVRSNPVQNGGSGPLPTVRIQHKDHPSGLIINESDFDPKIHTLFDPDAKPEKTAKPDKKRKADPLAHGDSGPSDPVPGDTTETE